MKSVLAYSVLVLSALLTSGFAGDIGSPPREEILERMVERSQQADKEHRTRRLTYLKLYVMEEMSDKGKVKSREAKLYEVHLDQGRVAMKLLEVNDAAASLTQVRQDASESSDLDSKEAKAPKGEERSVALTSGLIEQYRFTVAGRDRVNGRLAYELAFEAKDNLPARDMRERFLRALTGRVWVDAEDFDVVRAQVHLRSPVTLWGGVLGALKRFDYSLERVRLEDGTWFNRVSHGDFELRKLIFSRHFRTHSEWGVPAPAR